MSASVSEWYGELPRGWPLVRFKFAAQVRNGQVDPTSDRYRGLPLYAPNHIESATGRLLAIDTADEQGAESGKYPVRAGEIVYSKIRPALRKLAIAPEDGLCSADMYAIAAGKGLETKFLFWAMLGEPFYAYTLLSSDRVAMPKINREALAEVFLPRPPAPVQRAIADFLDRKTAAIDALIAKKERLIELLEEKRQALITQAVTKGLDPSVPMKDSGIEWLGPIPAHWTVQRLKHLARVQSGVTKGRDLDDATVELPYLRVANVQDGFVDLSDVATIEVAPHEVQRFSLQKGDLLMNEGGDNDKLGRGVVWEGQIDPCLHQNHVFALRPRPGVDGRWIALSIRSAPLKMFFQSRSKQSTNLASISSTNLKEAPIVLPPAAEALAIRRYVEANLSHFDRLVNRIQEHRDRLREYRQALITAAVTGKIDLTAEPK